jgi:hypothetical protein
MHRSEKEMPLFERHQFINTINKGVNLKYRARSVSA